MTESQYLVGDAYQQLKKLPAGCAQCCVTSPPYWRLRDYGVKGQLGLESTPELYIKAMARVFRQVRRVLADDGTLWLNIGDTYAAGGNGGGGSLMRHRKPKDLVGVPWMLAFALRQDGWYLRSEIIWHKTNPQPEPVRDRPSRAHEQLFLLAKNERYFYDADAISTPVSRKSLTVHTQPVKAGGNGRSAGEKFNAWLAANGGRKPNERANKRSVWPISSRPYPNAHFAVFPEALVSPCILAGSRPGDLVLDPFGGSGTVARVAEDLGRRWLLIDLNPEYAVLGAKRLRQRNLLST